MNSIVTKINLNDLSEKVDADYMDGDLLLIDDIKELPCEGSLQTDMLSIIICTEGRIQADMNGQTYTAGEGDMLVCPPNVFLNNYMITPIFNAKILCLSYEALQRLLHLNKDIWDIILYLSKNPVYHLSQESEKLMNNYYSLLSYKLKQQDGRYRKEVMHALFQAVFYDLVEILTPIAKEQNETGDSHIRQGDLLLKRFLKILADSQGKERSVAAFANQLCVSPKYLSTVCKASSGKTALEWIHEYTTEVIVQQLKYSDRTIKEIADGLEFPNISFFGKFVKTQLGVSPTQFRKQLANKPKECYERNN